MAGNIDMMNEGVSMGRSPESVVQSGGGGGSIEMWGDPVPLKQSPISTVPSGGGGAVDWVGEQGLLSTSPSPLYGQVAPTDKGTGH